VVCPDETTKQLIKETRMPVLATPGRPVRHDYEYERNGTVNLFLLFAPLDGWRHVEVTDRHAALNYACAQGFVGQTLARREQDRTGAGQFQHP
jgi:hypothetical protein